MQTLLLRLQPLAQAQGPEIVAPRHVVDLGARPRSASTPLARWSAVVAAAQDPCLLLDRQGRVISMSGEAGELLGCGSAGTVGRRLLDLIDLLDFDTGASEPDYAERVAPLAVLRPGTGLIRSLLRVRHPVGGVRTVDAAAAPLHDGEGHLIGSLTLFALLGG
jgi:PAS domain-containing protein